MRSLINFYLRAWYSINYSFCLSQAYLASHRGEGEVVAYWQTKADQWYIDWWRIGKELK